MKPKFASNFLALAATTIFTMTCAQAAPLTWDGGPGAVTTDDIVTPGTGTWTTGVDNWDNGLADGLNAAWTDGDDATFNGTAGTVTISGGVNAHNLTFDSGYTIEASTLTLSGGTPTVTTATSVTAIISSIISGSAGLTKAGAGTLTLSGANTYSGTTTVDAGQLVVSNTTNSSSFNTASGAILEYDVASSGSVTINPNQNVSITGAGIFRKTGTGTLGDGARTTTINMSAGGLIDIRAGAFNIGNTANDAFSSNLASLNIETGATVNTTAGGNVQVDALTGGGTLIIGEWHNLPSSTMTLTLGAAGGSGTFSGAIQKSVDAYSAPRLIKTGTGTQILTGTNTYTGTTTINDGTLQIGNGGTTGSAGTGAIVNNAALIYSYSNAGAANLSAGITGTGTLTATARDIKLGANITGGAINLTQIGGGVLYQGIELSATTTTITGTSISLSGDIGKRDSSGNTLILDTSATNGTVNLNVSVGRPSIWYGSTLNVNAGTGTININGTGPANSGFSASTLNGAINISTALAYLGGVTLNGPMTISGNIAHAGAAVFHATANSTISGNLGLAQSLTGYNAFNVDSGATMTVSGQLNAVSGSSWGGINKQGAGTLVLTNGTNAYGQGMQLNGGTVEFSNNALKARVSFDGPGHAADFQSNSTLRWGTGNTTDISANGAVAQIKIGDGITATFDTNGSSPTAFSKAFDLGTLKTGALAKTGSGTLTLSAANTYTGATQVNGGTLVIGTSGSLANTAVTVGGSTATGTPTLAGGGTIGGATEIASAGAGAVGIHAPGVTGVANGVGSQTFSSTLNYQSGSIFEWNLSAISTTDPGANASDAATGTYDKVVANGIADSVTGTAAVFKVVIGGNNFSDEFWNSNKSWTNIFSGTGAPTNLASIFTSFSDTDGLSGGNGTVTGQGQFTLNGSSLTWTAVPEPTSALAGLLLGAGLLRRRRGKSLKV